MALSATATARTKRNATSRAAPRRAEWGQHNRISGKYLGAYAREMVWREDPRRRPNGALHTLAAGAALAHPVSRMWKGYWQRAERA